MPKLAWILWSKSISLETLQCFISDFLPRLGVSGVKLLIKMHPIHETFYDIELL